MHNAHRWLTMIQIILQVEKKNFLWKIKVNEKYELENGPFKNNKQIKIESKMKWQTLNLMEIYNLKAMHNASEIVSLFPFVFNL